MTYRRGAALVLAAIAVGAWLAITAGRGMPAPPPAARTQPPVSSPLDPISRSVQSQAGRLREYLATRPPLARPSRDPFAFRDRPGLQSPALPAAAASIVSALNARPPLSLAGIATDQSPDGPVCTAIISGMGQVFLVKDGETFGGRFQVVRVGAESVQIKDRTTETTITLALK